MQTVTFVMFGLSKFLSKSRLASAAKLSPARNGGSWRTAGCLENLAETAHNARTNTGGAVPLLGRVRHRDLAEGTQLNKGDNLP